MKIRRRMQLDILLHLKERYPLHATADEMPHSDDENFNANLHYLIEHGLVEGNVIRDHGFDLLVVNPRLTARGLDFLEDDGGPVAILDERD
jgi:hypothetical protein